MTGEAEAQRRIATVLLGAVGDSGFALAGSGAIREHGLTERPTEDIDLFGGPTTTVDEFRAALTRAEDALREAGYAVTWLRAVPLFARLRATDPDGALLDVDFATNWRADPPVILGVGAVLSERDAVAGKLSAVYSRGEVRDFLDLDAIRASGRYTDADIIALGHEHDDGFDERMFAAQLSRVVNYLPSEASEYGVTPEAFHEVQQRILSWAAALRANRAGNTSDGAFLSRPAVRREQPERDVSSPFPVHRNKPDRRPPAPSL